ncbi:proteasome-interacting protein cic1 [Coemansia javaensis]|uniref:Proteasome-interacting protein cic1 n=1 Tax=Coemansia javaensis TaxID=2761396 RepID=A0A9W8H774_9FUNG|nr:proteasome-interacting protein cic1 [Coemansia javaensis]
MALSRELATLTPPCLASESLIKHAREKQEQDAPTNLLADDAQLVYLIVGVKSVAAQMQHKPRRIPLKAPLYGESSSVCLITKSNDEAHVEKLRALKVPQIKEIVSMAQLKTEYKAFEARRLLLATHDLFLADDRIINSLPAALGVKFFKAKKLPAPVNLKAANLRAEMDKALSCTYFRQNKGTCNAIKVGLTTMPAADLADNIASAADLVAQHIPKGWDGIQSIGIKTGTSLTLPVYNALPNAATGIGASGATVETVALDADASDEPEAPEEKPAKKAKKQPAPKAKGARKSPLTRTKADSMVKAFANKHSAAKV